MYIQIAVCLPVALLFLSVLYITGLLCNKALAIFRTQSNQGFLNFAGHCAIGFVFWLRVHATIVSTGKTTLAGVLLLLSVHALFYRGSNTGPDIKAEMRTIFRSGVFWIVTSVLVFCYLFLLWQHWPAFVTGYPLVYYDYQFYALVSKGMGITGLENPLSMFRGYGLECGTMLYHYCDLWIVDLLARITHLNRLLIVLFVIYPIMLCLLISGMAATIRFVTGHIGNWQILLLFVATLGFNLYLSNYSNMPLLNNFGLNCFPGLYQAHKLSIIYVLVFCALFQFLLMDAQRSVLWLCILCIVYPTVIPAICGGTFITLVLLYLVKKINLRLAINLLMFLAITVGYILIFDHLFSDRPKQAVKLDFLPQIKLITVLFASYLLKLAIVFFPTLILLFVRLIYKIKFNPFETVIWLFVIGATCSSIAFASENHGTINISQAIYNIIPPLVIIASLVSLAVFLKSGIPVFVKTGLFFMLFVFACHNLYADFKKTSHYLSVQNPYSKTYITECLNEIDKKEKSAAPVNIALVDSNELFLWYYDFFQKASFLFYSSKVTATLDISPFLQSEKKYTSYFRGPDDYNNPIEKWLKKNSPGQLKFDTPLLLKYFADYHIEYLDVSSDYRFPYEVTQHLQLISRDSNTGEEFYKINL